LVLVISYGEGFPIRGIDFNNSNGSIIAYPFFKEIWTFKTFKCHIRIILCNGLFCHYFFKWSNMNLKKIVDHALGGQCFFEQVWNKISKTVFGTIL
jgi:hypothetical protein